MPNPMPPAFPRSAPSAIGTALFRLAAATLVLCVAACASRTPAPVEDRAPRATPPAAATAAKPSAEPDWRPKAYTVKRGDTLYGIALDHGLDYRELAAWNNIDNINLIRPGQVLRLTAPGSPAPGGSAAAGAAGVVTAPLKAPPPVVASDARAPASPPPPPSAAPAVPGARGTDDYKTQPKAVKEPYSEQALRDVQRAGSAVAAAVPVAPAGAPAPAAAPAAAAPPAAAVPAAPAATVAAAAPPAVADAAPADAKTPSAADGDDDKVDWMWPAKGRIVNGFSEGASLKGIDIGGAAGQPVAASAGGKVVYAGTGLRGYGKLIIIKHNATFLSAYAHNRDILVKEGQQVARGQKIAEMGSTDSDQVKLHFEIRRHGKPMDPLRYLPPA